jgi:DNA-binding transcriptional MerR regulator
MRGLLIGEVAERTGLTAPTIRYYESIGLLKAPARSSTGYRRYDDSTIEELIFIKKAQTLGFSLDEIGEILRLSRSGRRPCSHVLELASRHLAVVEERIQQLERFRMQLAGEIAKWKHRPLRCSGLCEIITTQDTAIEPIHGKLPSRVPQHRHGHVSTRNQTPRRK